MLKRKTRDQNSIIEALYEAQKMLGPADPRTTMRYAHLGQDALVTAAETVSKLLESGTQAQTQSPTEVLA